MRTALLSRSLGFVASTLLLAACGGANMARSAAEAPASEEAASAPPPPAQPGVATADDGPMPLAAAPVAPSVATSVYRKPDTSKKEAAVAKATPEVATSGVRAGEWDDNANYRDFLSYISQQEQLGINKMDMSHREFVVVEDKNGRGVANCKVDVSDGKRSIALKTAASGRAILFPVAEGLRVGKLTASTSCLSAKSSIAFDTSGADGSVLLKLGSARPVEKKATVDVVFVLDTTGSMSEEIASIKSTLRAVVDHVGPDAIVRVGLVEYKDRSDQFVTKMYPLTSDLKKLSSEIAGIEAGGGGDIPEDVDAGLSTAIDKMGWNDQATARLAFLVADAPPHLDYADSVSYTESSLHAAARGIKIFTVSASGMDDLGQAVFRQIAQSTGGTNMFVLRGGAGPQSTGAGDAKSSCGTTHQNFTSGNLDQLITDKIALEVQSLGADPMRIAGLGKDENAKPCEQRIQMVVAR